MGRTEPLGFAGADVLVKLLGALCLRPRFGDRPRKLDEQYEWTDYQDERSERRGLPMVCLVRPPENADVLPAVADRLKTAKPHGSIRYANPGLAVHEGRDEAGPATADSVTVVRDILREARKELGDSAKAHTSRLPFPLFDLVYWLMLQDYDGHDNPDGALRHAIRRISLAERFSSSARDAAQQLPENQGVWKLFSLLVRGLTLLTFRIAVTGRMPGLSGRYRWFLRQPHLAPEMSGSFVRFARRLTEGQWQEEAPEYVCRLLLNAFLEDLRRAYRLRPWRVWRRRRMTYPVLLLDEVSVGNGGYRLLELVNSVRNQVGQFDPLLVISASPAPPPDAEPTPHRPQFQAEQARAAYVAWQNQLERDRRERRPNAWYLPIGIRPPAGADEPGIRRMLHTLEPLRFRRQVRPPWWVSRWTRIGVPVVVVALVAGFVAYRYHDTYVAHCRSDNPWLVWTGSECVGTTDGAQDIFQPSDATIRQVEAVVLDQNHRAEELHLARPERPYITLVVLQALTSSNNVAEGLTSERETLEGVAVAQLRQLNAPGSADPIVRVLIANAGRNMRQGVRVANLLRQQAEQDKSIVGVVGLDMSSEPTQQTIAALTNAGLPMVASTLSADPLADLNPMYFQVSPQNRREAAVAAGFAEQLPGPRTVRVYYSDDNADVYSTNLRDDVLQSFRAKGFQAEARAFTPDGGPGGPASHLRYGDALVGNAGAAGRDICSFDGIAFFAGRGVPDFGQFLGGAAQCGSRATVIGDDDVSRFVADQGERRRIRALPYYYLSFATAPVTAPKGVALDFYTTLDQVLFPFEQTPEGRSYDGYAALAYDAAQVMIVAAAYLRETAAEIPVTPGAIWRQITAIHTSRPGAKQVNKYLEGVTGTIDFGGDISRNVPQNKPVAVMAVVGGEVDKSTHGFCGAADGPTSDTWCPVDP
ncbi:hypothetical protein [Amycolatopsis sp.]|uniref:hypothetical protein n=1 Tax=Amycolatopsis sp. TaxID=37632 RepID=UPI002D80DFF1|nr:hypothetical protein [Amycolatopsis sp.]HET6711689.1 hypothetical protein [Amycolatopsis sp.]